MALARRERSGSGSALDWPSELVRRFVEGNFEGNNMMRVEEFRDEDDLVVRAEMPGIDPDNDVELTVDDGTLHIRAQRQEKSEHSRNDGYRTEFRYGAFMRSVPLPDGAKEDDVKATYRDGILEIRVPVAQETKQTATKIPVSRG